MVDDRPSWARRMANERHARGWSQADAVQVIRAREGDLEGAVDQGQRALTGERKIAALPPDGHPRSHQGPQRPVSRRNSDAGLPRPDHRAYGDTCHALKREPCRLFTYLVSRWLLSADSSDLLGVN